LDCFGRQVDFGDVLDEVNGRNVCGMFWRMDALKKLTKRGSCPVSACTQLSESAMLRWLITSSARDCPQIAAGFARGLRYKRRSGGGPVNWRGLRGAARPGALLTVSTARWGCL
jgi:hypothetical protein